MSISPPIKFIILLSCYINIGLAQNPNPICNVIPNTFAPGYVLTGVSNTGKTCSWQSGGGITLPVSPSNGGTGVSNGIGSTITLAGPITQTGTGGFTFAQGGSGIATLSMTGGAANSFSSYINLPNSTTYQFNGNPAYGMSIDGSENLSISSYLSVNLKAYDGSAYRTMVEVYGNGTTPGVFIGQLAQPTFGGTNTMLVGNGTATTGVTTSVCQDGAGQSTTACFQVKTNGGTANVTITGGGIITDLPQAASGGTPAILCINSSGQIVKGSTATCTGT